MSKKKIRLSRKYIDDLKIEITLKVLSGKFNPYDYFSKIPNIDELRSFLCSLGIKSAYFYAQCVDHGPHDETRKACLSNYVYAFAYAMNIDKCARPDTREAVYKDSNYKKYYIIRFGE